MITPVDPVLRAAAQAHLDALAKPPGSLGRLEGLAVRLACAQGKLPPTANRPRVVVFAADHGAPRAHALSPYPPEVTASMVRTFASGRAAVCALARQAGAELEVVDVGVIGITEDLPAADGVRLVRAPVGPGTRDLVTGPAMGAAELEQALEAGRAAARRAAQAGVDVLALGEMGIGNTTAAAAVAARLLGRPAAELVGPGTGLDAEGVARKATLVQRALDRGGPGGPLAALADLGGFELAALAGCMLEAGRLRIPIVLDGFIVGASALAAVRHAPALSQMLIAATASAEPGHRAVLEALGVEAPLLDWGLRLGEASGAALTLPLLRSACAVYSEMATLAEVLGG